jgi:hypothetical protein
LHQRNYSIGRIPNDSFTLNTIYIGMTYGTTLTYSLVSNPNSAVVLTGSTIKPNTSMASSGLKEYTIKVTLTNSNFPNTISYEQSFQIRYGAATRFSLTTDTGGY